MRPSLLSVSLAVLSFLLRAPRPTSRYTNHSTFSSSAFIQKEKKNPSNIFIILSLLLVLCCHSERSRWRRCSTLHSIMAVSPRRLFPSNLWKFPGRSSCLPSRSSNWSRDPNQTILFASFPHFFFLFLSSYQCP